MGGSQIRLGNAMITLVEPHRDGLVEYNRWYEHDHAYAAMMSAPGCFAYRRFVATRPLKDLRIPAESPMAQPLDTGSFVAFYWIEEGLFDKTFEYSFGVTPGLAERGRMNPDRDHVSTATYEYLGSAAREPEPVPVEMALDHPYPGVVCAWLRPADGVTVAELGEWCRATLDPPLLADGSPVGLVADFAQCDFPGGIPPLTGKLDELVRCWFLDTDPRDCWDRFAGLAEAVADGGKGSLALAAPFIATVPGTTRYLDELW
ncbi:MAG: hypothetical protein KDB21_16755 [Acidimicrobiales bacterium]|nr:hypothetical protein [Acidimicrobiales bacterium]